MRLVNVDDGEDEDDRRVLVFEGEWLLLAVVVVVVVTTGPCGPFSFAFANTSPRLAPV